MLKTLFKSQLDPAILKTQTPHIAQLLSLAQMAGSIAHEVYNPLGVLLARLEDLRAITPATEADRERLEASVQKIDEMAQRILKIVKSIKAFSRNEMNDEFSSTEVSEIIEDALQFCRYRVRQMGIKIEVKIERPGLRASCRHAQISQLLLNLLQNACDAVEGRPDQRIEVRVAELADAIEFSVVDSGSGIPAELRSELMRPFYTTKQPGKGTGLGLTVAKDIAEAHGGALWLDETSANTCFKVRLPKPAC